MAGKSRKQRIRDLERFVETTGAEYGKVPTTRKGRHTRKSIEQSPGFFGQIKAGIEGTQQYIDTARKRLKGWQKRQAHRGAERMRRMKEFREGK